MMNFTKNAHGRRVTGASRAGLLSVALMFALSACSGGMSSADKPGDEPQPQTRAEPAPVVEESVAAAEMPKPGADAKTQTASNVEKSGSKSTYQFSREPDNAAAMEADAEAAAAEAADAMEEQAEAAMAEAEAMQEDAMAAAEEAVDDMQEAAEGTVVADTGSTSANAAEMGSGDADADEGGGMGIFLVIGALLAGGLFLFRNQIRNFLGA